MQNILKRGLPFFAKDRGSFFDCGGRVEEQMEHVEKGHVAIKHALMRDLFSYRRRLWKYCLLQVMTGLRHGCGSRVRVSVTDASWSLADCGVPRRRSSGLYREHATV